MKINEKKIIQSLNNQIVPQLLNSNNNYLGLFTGDIGSAIFFFNMYKYFKNEDYLKYSVEIIENNINQINLSDKNYSLSSGISGIGWALDYFYKKKFIYYKDKNLFKSINNYIFDEMNVFFEKKDYDFIHGALGIGFYLLTVKDLKIKKNTIESIISNLDSQKHVFDNEFIAWIDDSKSTNNELYYNLGLAHGIASIIAFLNKIYLQDSTNSKNNYLLENSIKFLLDKELNYNENGFHFQNYYSIPCQKLEKSRLGWCYGDIGIATVLYNAGVSLRNNEIINKSIEILKNNTSRKNLIESKVHDAGICHGSSGIMHMYNKIYNHTKLIEFKKAREFWMEKTLEIIEEQSGEYKPNNYSEYFKNDICLLTGVSGIGLTLLGYLDNQYMDWDECLLLS